MGKHHEWRKSAKKLRRKRIRQKAAIQRAKAEEEERKRRENSPTHIKWLQEQKADEEFREHEEKRLHDEAERRWLNEEEEAQARWKEIQIKIAKSREERAIRDALIREEWEREKKRLEELKQQKAREEEEKERRQLELQAEIEHYVAFGGDVPAELQISYDSNPGKEACPFFLKTGACRFGNSCSRNHSRPGISRILLMSGFYSHISLGQTDSEHGQDLGLEFEQADTYNHFKEFFYDIVDEFEKCGRLRQIRVCSNQEQHLRGNVYVEYSSRREAIRAFQVFQGRWYNGKQLTVQFCKIQSWKSAICGLHFKQRCPKGSSCNFLHVFRNPRGLFGSIENDSRRSSKRGWT